MSEIEITSLLDRVNELSEEDRKLLAKENLSNNDLLYLMNKLNLRNDFN